MGHYSESAEFYDLLYGARKDHGAEADLLAELIRARCPEARTILDVGCGTGAHARALTDAGFEVDGVDLEPTMVATAAVRCPEGTFSVGDMVDFDAPRRYDVVVSLFSAIGYARTYERLRDTVTAMRRHLNDGGLLIVDPWFEPGELTHGFVSTLAAEEPGRAVCRVSRTVIEGTISRMEFEYLVGTAEGIERRSEVHELGLFTQDQMESALRAVGLSVERIPRVLRTRGIYLARA